MYIYVVCYLVMVVFVLNVFVYKVVLVPAYIDVW